MHKKILFGFLLLSTIIIFGITYTFAADNDSALKDATNTVRNVVGDAENGVENAAKDISNTSKDVTGDLENDGSKSTSDNNKDNRNAMVGTTMNSDSGNYTATRTSTLGDGNFMGMNSTAWIWLIMAILAVAIIGLVYYYSAQVTNKDNYNDDNQ